MVGVQMLSGQSSGEAQTIFITECSTTAGTLIRWLMKTETKPYLPIWRQEGSIILERLIKDFVDRNGNQAELSLVIWKDKKGKQHESVHTVRWKGEK